MKDHRCGTLNGRGLCTADEDHGKDAGVVKKDRERSRTETQDVPLRPTAHLPTYRPRLNRLDFECASIRCALSASSNILESTSLRFAGREGQLVASWSVFVKWFVVVHDHHALVGDIADRNLPFHESMASHMTDIFSMRDKIVFISGASSGLGAHFANTLARADAKVVVLAARRLAKLREIADKLADEHPDTSFCCVRMDVLDLKSISNAFDVAQRFAGSPCDVLINCAGIGKPKLALKVQEIEFDKVISVNLKGAFFCAQEMCQRLVENNLPGVIVMVGSILGIRNSRRQSSYCASKAGLLHLSRVLATEFRPHAVRVNCLSPGYFLTEMTKDFLEKPAGQAYISQSPPGRLGRLKELDGPLLLLSSDAGSFMNAHNLVVDLGHSNASL